MKDKDNLVVLGAAGLLAYYYYSQQIPPVPFQYPVGVRPTTLQPGTQTPPITGQEVSAVGTAVANGVETAVKWLGEGVRAVAVSVAAGAKWIVTSIASTGPVGIAIAAGVIAGLTLIEVFRGTAHNVANEIVQQLENPFRDHLSMVIDPKDAAANAGTLTCDEENAAIQAVQTLWAQYQVAAQEFASKGGDYATVARQSLENLNGPNGVIQYVPDSQKYDASGFVDALIAKMQWHIANVLGC